MCVSYARACTDIYIVIFAERCNLLKTLNKDEMVLYTITYVERSEDLCHKVKCIKYVYLLRLKFAPLRFEIQTSSNTGITNLEVIITHTIASTLAYHMFVCVCVCERECFQIFVKHLETQTENNKGKRIGRRQQKSEGQKQ